MQIKSNLKCKNFLGEKRMGAGAIPGSARSHKSTSINFKATEPNIAKQTVQKPKRKSISKKNKTKYQSL